MFVLESVAVADKTEVVPSATWTDMPGELSDAALSMATGRPEQVAPG